MIANVRFQDYLIERLKDPEIAIEYLNAALEEGEIKLFLLSLRNVIEAQGGINKLAIKTHKSRTSLYKALSEKGNPHLKNTNEILSAMNMRLAIVSNHSKFKQKTHQAK